MYRASALAYRRYGADDTLTQLSAAEPRGRQIAYLRQYLADLNATATVEEPQYFCRDFLAEFAAFYSQSASGYSNVCRRVNFFRNTASGQQVGRGLFRRALGGDRRAVDDVQDAYLGSVVVRPIPGSRIGRTVLASYPDDRRTTPQARVLWPARDYVSHVAGLPLTVESLAWQSASAVGACATIAVWSLLHASPFDDYHVPTATAITVAANRSFPVGTRVFPSGGLRLEQTLEAIKEHNFSPLVIRGDVATRQGDRFFSVRILGGRREAMAMLLIRARRDGLVDYRRRSGRHRLSDRGRDRLAWLRGRRT